MGCSNLQPLWSVPQQWFLPEATSSIYFHFLCCLIYFQERLQVPAPLEALKFLFSKPQAITDKISITLPCWLQLIAPFTNHHFQHGGAMRGYAPGWHISYSETRCWIFYSDKILTDIGPNDIFSISGALPEQPWVRTSKLKTCLWCYQKDF